MMEKKSQAHRRDFLKSAAVGAAGLSAASQVFGAPATGKVLGANDRIGVGFIGTGSRCQAHLDIIKRLAEENKGAVPAAVCDVWDGNDIVKRGLYYSQQKVGLSREKAYRDYRKLLDDKDVDVVCIAAPDHWHARLSIDAAAAGQHVHCEKPMTPTIDPAHAVVDAMKKDNKVMTVGVQSMAEARWRRGPELVCAGEEGPLGPAQTSPHPKSGG